MSLYIPKFNGILFFSIILAISCEKGQIQTSERSQTEGSISLDSIEKTEEHDPKTLSASIDLRVDVEEIEKIAFADEVVNNNGSDNTIVIDNVQHLEESDLSSTLPKGHGLFTAIHSI